LKLTTVGLKVTVVALEVTAVGLTVTAVDLEATAVSLKATAVGLKVTGVGFTASEVGLKVTAVGLKGSLRETLPTGISPNLRDYATDFPGFQNLESLSSARKCAVKRGKTRQGELPPHLKGGNSQSWPHENCIFEDVV
jgi:hypothetical protein